MVKQQLFAGILLAVLSQFVCITDARMHMMHMEEPQQPDFLDRSYIKGENGERRTSTEMDPSSLVVTTTTDPDGTQRHLVESEIRCRLWQNCLVDAVLGDVHDWECTFDDPKIQQTFGGFESKLIVVEGVENTNKFLELNGAESAKTVLVMNVVDIQYDKIVVLVENVVGVERLNNMDRVDTGGSLRDPKPVRTTSRNLATPTGTKDTVVIRVNANDNSPGFTSAQISSDVFTDPYCLKSQYAACSYNQLTIREYVPGNGVSNVATSALGVIDININMNAEGGNRETAQSLANQALTSLLGESPGNVFDLVLFCMPPGMGDWLAYAYIGRWDSYYNNEWCQAMSSQMHEVGHSIGLHHSGEYTGSDSVQEYGDQSDMMGYSYNSDDTPKMCFNPAKNWQLGWYGNKVLEVNPSTDLSIDPTTYYLNGVVDYLNASARANIVIKLGNFYIGYNKATSFNSEVQEGANQVLVNEKLGTPESSSLSKLASKLSIGDFYDIPVTPTLTVTVGYEALEGNDARITLAVKGETPTCQAAFDQSIEVELTTDNWPQETYWAILDGNGQAVFEYNPTAVGTFTNTVPNLCPGLEYYFLITDQYSDGICCQYGNGSYRGTYGNLLLFSGDGQFGDQDLIPFTIPLPQTPAPTNAPQTPAPTNAPTNPPTNAPEPTDPPTTNQDECVDDTDYVYRNKDGKDCDWVNHNTDRKTRIVCLRRANEDTNDKRRVLEYCRRTCEDAGIKKSC